MNTDRWEAAVICGDCPSDSADAFPIYEDGVIVLVVFRCKVCAKWTLGQ